MGREGAKSSVSTKLGGLKRTTGGGHQKFSRWLFWGRNEKTSGDHARGASGSQAGTDLVGIQILNHIRVGGLGFGLGLGVLWVEVRWFRAF